MVTHNNKSGFTLIELMLSVVLFTIIAGMSIPIFNSVIPENSVRADVDLVTHALQRARYNAITRLHNVDWSARITSNEVTIFDGSDFATRTPARDREIILSGNSQIATTDITFTSRTGAAAPSNVSVTSQDTTTQVQINQLGIISSQ